MKISPDTVILARFVDDLTERATKNLAPATVKDLKKLITATILGKRYDRTTEEEIREIFKDA